MLNEVCVAEAARTQQTLTLSTNSLYMNVVNSPVTNVVATCRSVSPQSTVQATRIAYGKQALITLLNVTHARNNRQNTSCTIVTH